MSLPAPEPATPPGPSVFGRVAAWTLVVSLAAVAFPAFLFLPLAFLIPATVRQWVRSESVPTTRRQPGDVVFGILTGVGLVAVVVPVAAVSFATTCTAAYLSLAGPNGGSSRPDVAEAVGMIFAGAAGGGLAYLFCWLLDHGGAPHAEQFPPPPD